MGLNVGLKDLGSTQRKRVPNSDSSLYNNIRSSLRMISSLSFILLLATFTGVDCDFVCKSVADSIFDAGNQACREAQNRIQALEEQVKLLVPGMVSTGITARFPDVPTDCSDLFGRGMTQSGVFLISPDGRCPFHVYCHMEDGGWTGIQRRQDGGVSFYRTWQEYVEGFGDVAGEYWLGLEKIRRLTEHGMEIAFDIENYDGSKDHAHYKTFVVQSAQTKYTMNVDAFGYNGSLAELFSNHDNMPFTTFDRDNDKHSSVNCAMDYDGGGWWFKDCYTLGNLNGIFNKRGKGGISHWDNIKMKIVYIKKVTIKLRQKKGLC